MIRVILFTSLLASSCPALAADTLSEASQQRARAILDRAIAAAGGHDALLEITSVAVRADGQVRPRLQTPTVSPPFEAARQSEAFALDLATGRFRFEQRYDGFGLRNDYAIKLDGAEARLADHVTRTDASFPLDDAEDRRLRAQRRVPQLLLRQALAEPAALRHLGEAEFEGKPHEVITFPSGGQALAIYVDTASGIVSKYELLFSDPLASQDAAEIVFADYGAAGKLLLPRRQVTRQAGEVVAEWRLQIEINPPEARFSPAPAEESYARVDPPDTSPATERLGQGAWLLRNVAGADYHTLVVEFEDHAVVIDAPVSVAGSGKVIARIQDLLPGKPIRYVVLTHHHADHIGGLKAFVAAGATLVAMPGLMPVVESVAALDAEGVTPAPRALKFQPVEDGRLVLQDAAQRLELVNVGPLPHAQEILVAWLPRQRVVFQSDLFFGSPTAFSRLSATDAAAAELARKLRVAGIEADTVAGGHGRMASWQELEGTTAQAAAVPQVLGRELPPGFLNVVEARDAVELCQESVFPTELLAPHVPAGHRLALLPERGERHWASALVERNPQFAGYASGVFCFIEAEFTMNGQPLHAGGRGAMAFWWADILDDGSAPADPRYKGAAPRAQVAYIYDADTVDRALALAATPNALFGKVRMERDGESWSASAETADGRLTARLTPTSARRQIEYSTPAYTTVPWIDPKHRDHFNVITYMGHHEREAVGEWQASGEALWARLFGSDPSARHRSMIQDGVSANLALYRREVASGR